MKKAVSILILFIYVSLSALQVISIHYCQGQFDSIAFTTEKNECCNNDHIDHTSCCDDFIIEIDFDVDHIYSAQLDIDRPEISDVFALCETESLLNDNTGICDPNYWQEISPPPKLYLLKQSFLFYG
jgi:hypothetical protein